MGIFLVKNEYIFLAKNCGFFTWLTADLNCRDNEGKGQNLVLFLKKGTVVNQTYSL